MFCPKCGEQIDEGAGLCGKCGNPVREAVAVKKSGLSKKILVFSFLALMLVLAGVVLMVFLFGDNKEREYNKQMELAERYLDELDYDKAIEAFYAAIDIDPSNSEAYIELSTLYEKNEDYDSALRILKEAKRKTDGEGIRKRIKRVEEKLELLNAETEEIAEVDEMPIVEESEPVEAEEESEDQAEPEAQEPAPAGGHEWKAAYRELIIENYDEWERSFNENGASWDDFRGVAFIYLDDDDIPELLTQYGITTETAYATRIYTYKQGGLSKLTADTFEVDNGQIPNDCLPIEGYMEKSGMLVTHFIADFHLEEMLFQLNGDKLEKLAYYKGDPQYGSEIETIDLTYLIGDGGIQTENVLYDEYYTFVKDFWKKADSLYGYDNSKQNYVEDAGFMFKEDALEWLR